MAAIEQVIQIATNREGAVNDVYSALLSSTAITGLQEINIQHLPTGTDTDDDLVQRGTGANAVVFEGTGLTQVVREGSGATAVVRAGSTNILRDGAANLSTLRTAVAATSTNFTVNGNDIDVSTQAVNLSDVRTFTNVAARNAENTVAWHQGDIAIVTSNTMMTSSGSAQLPGTPQVAQDAFVADSIADRDTIANFLTDDMDADGNGRRTVANDVTGTYGPTAADQSTGTISVPAGTEFFLNGRAVVFVSLTGFRTGPQLNNAVVVLTGGNISGPTVDTGVGSGTYVYTGMDQVDNNGDDDPAATTDASWTILRAPSDSAGLADLATFEDDDTDSTPRRLSMITFNSDGDMVLSDGLNTRTFAGGGGGISGVNLRRNHYRTQITISARTSDMDMTNDTITVPITNFTAVSGSGSDTLGATFGETATFYLDGIKIFEGPPASVASDGTITQTIQNGDFQFNADDDQIVITIINPRRPGPGEAVPPGILELETITTMTTTS